jgi:hypothetical protein
MEANLKDFYKSKDTEVLFKQENFDTKKKTNRSSKKIEISQLSTIEKGITSEQLDAFKVPVFKYGGQITIHGQFPELSHALHIGGYKNIFQNKNLSLGVKYDAIDYEKKKRIYKAFNHIYGFHIEHNSKEFCVYKMIKVTDREDALNRQAENQPLMNKIDIPFGNKRMYFAQIPLFGTFLVLTVHINAIYEKDIPGFFLKTFGRTEEDIFSEIKRIKEEKEMEYERQMDEWRKQREAEKEKTNALLKKEEALLPRLGYKKTENIPVKDGLTVLFLTVTTDYDTREQKPVYNLWRFYKPQKAKLFQVVKRNFSSMEKIQEIAGNLTESYFDDKYRKDVISGYIIK